MKQSYLKCIETNKHITNICGSIDKDDEYVILENLFFDMFCYNEYVKDTYETNKLLHFEKILKDEGFKLSTLGDKNKLDKQVKEEAKEMADAYNEELYEEYKESQNREDVKYSKLNENLEALGLLNADNATLDEHKKVFMNKYKMEEYFHTVALLRSDEYVDDRINKAYETMYDVRVMTSTYNKIKLLRTLEATYNIAPFDITTEKDEAITMDDKTHQLYQKVFRSKKEKPTNHKQLKQIYVGLIKNITSHDIISSKQLSTKAQRNQRVYSINEELIQEHLKLYKRYMPTMENIKPCFLKMFDIEVDEVEEEMEFIDEDDDDEYVDDVVKDDVVDELDG